MKHRLVLSLCVLSYVAHADHAAAQWATNGNAMATATNHQTSPLAASDGAGGAIIVWQDQRNNNFDIYGQRVNAWGQVQWGANGAVIRLATNDQTEPRIVSDGAGGAIVFYLHKGNNGNTDVYAQHVDAAGFNQWLPNGALICAAQNDQHSVAVIADGAGGAIATWQDARGGSNMVSDVYAQRVNSAGLVQWTADGVAISTAANGQWSPVITDDGAGGAIIAWADYRSGVVPDIYARRINAAGVAQWTADGVAVNTAAGTQTNPSIASDGAGGAIIAWSDEAGGSNDIYAQRLNAAGAAQWTGGGIPICEPENAQQAPRAVPDGAGGAIIAWIDLRNLTDYDIFAQRVNASGSLLWEDDGVAVCQETGDSGLNSMVPDGAGGALLAWFDTRLVNLDIYAQRIDAHGNARWTANGMPVCVLGGGQNLPSIAPDGSGGAIVAFQDFRSGSTNDIYANRVSAGGSIPTAIGRTPANTLIASHSSPNPFSAQTTIEITLPGEADVNLEIFDVAGRRVRALSIGLVKAGTTPLAFDGRDERGHQLPSGVYFCRIHAGSESLTRKMVIQR
jgi:hypothetical protein